MKSLAARRIYIGTSSWKYKGWEGLVYHRTYESEKIFEQQCLEEYSEQYTTVGVDHTYYTWPIPSTFERYVTQTPAGFTFGLKVTEKITCFRFPQLPRYGKEAGKLNEGFLDPTLFREKFLAPLEPFRGKLGPIMLEFSQFYPGTLVSGSEFVDKLDRFFSALKEVEGFCFAVEIRNANWLKKPYFEILYKHQVAHVYNSWTRMPPIGMQLKVAEPQRAPVLISRALLQAGIAYEQAVEAYSPYHCIQQELPSLRDDIAVLIERAMEWGIPAYVFVNNRAEGCAPLTILGILERVKINPGAG